MIKTTLREIKGSLGRYLAILAIVMLGVGFFAGLKMTKPSMANTTDAYLEEQNFFDYRLLSTIGFTQDDVEALKDYKEAANVEGTLSADALVLMGEENEVVYKFHSLPENINLLSLTAGRMPKATDECILDASKAGENAIGSVIHITDENAEETLDMFEERSLTVVGLANSPYYLNFERGTSSIGDGRVEGFVYIPKEAFACDYLTDIFLTLKRDYPIYSDSYENYIDVTKDELENLTGRLVQDRYDGLIADANQEIADAQKELDNKKMEAETELADALKEIEDGEQEIADAEIEIADAEQEIADGEKEIADGKKEIADAEIEIADAEQEIADGEKEIADNAWRIFDAELQIAEGEQRIEAAEKEIEEGARRITAGKKEISDKRKELEEGRTQLEQAGILLSEQEEDLEEQMQDLETAHDAGFISDEQYDEDLAGIEYGKLQLKQAREELDIREAQLDDGAIQLNAAKEELDRSKAELEEARRRVEGSKRELEKARAELEEPKRELEEARIELEEGKAELEQAKADVEEAKRELEKGKKELKDAKTELEEAKSELEQAKIDLEDGRAEYEDSKAEFDKEVADAQTKIDDARAELDEIEDPDYYVLTRNANIGYICFENDSNIVEAISDVFPLFFFLVAALICMTTMNRMVEEQRTQIGILKALGYSNAAIMGKYAFYAGSAAVIGAVMGFAGGTWMFPKVIWQAYRIMYYMEDINYQFSAGLAAISLAAALVCSVGTAYLSCYYELYSVPANLIRPKAPKNGKRIFLEKLPFVWSRMKFLHKVSMRNVVRYKKRFFMMVLGISGCTALLVTGFGLKDSITGIAELQFDEVQVYDIGLSLTDGTAKSDRERLRKETSDDFAYMEYHYEKSVDMDFAGKTKSIYLLIPEDPEEMSRFLKLHTEEGEEISYPKEGEAVVSAKAAQNMGIQIGDQVVLRDADMRQIRVKISGICENFVYHYIYISKETYIEQLGEEPEYLSAFAGVKEGTDVHIAAAAASKLDNVMSVSVTLDTKERIASMMESMDYIVLLVIICAASLALIVLYNLTNINITERIREIATIKVLGFYARETADYVFRENIVLTGIGALVGLALGKALHWFVMYNVNIDMISFRTYIKPMSYLLGLLLTFCFAIFVNLLMQHKLDKINMAESLKSIE